MERGGGGGGRVRELEGENLSKITSGKVWRRNVKEDHKKIYPPGKLWTSHFMEQFPVPGYLSIFYTVGWMY